MLKNLPNEVYGLSLSLVEISDASDIVALRSNPELTQFMVTVEHNVSNQEEWIRKYKAREKLGEDFYFAYRRGAELVGFARLSHIDYLDRTCSFSSWIKNPNVKGGGAHMLLSRLDIAFEYLNLDKVYASIHGNNSKAMRYWKCFNCTINKKPNGYNDLIVTSLEYYKNREIFNNKFVKN